MKRIHPWLRTAVLTALAALAATTANAASGTDVSNHAIVCSTVTGTMSFGPALNDTGLSVLIIKLKGKLAGCVDTTDGNVLIDSGTFSGVITDPTNYCPDLITTFQPPASVAGTIVYKWKANKNTPILPTQSTQTVTTRTGDIFVPGGALGSALYVQSGFATGGVTGAFMGGDGGASSSSIFVSSQDWLGILSLCATTGVKAFNIGLGVVTLQ